MIFQIDFECYWDKPYPVPVSYGTFYRKANNVLEILVEIHRDWLHLPWILDYTFIVSSETEFIVVSRKAIE